MHTRNYQPIPPESIDPAFGNWLAGFIDGEGCFILRPPPAGQTRWACVFSLIVRDDDRAIIEEIVARTGFGAIEASAGVTSGRAGWRVMRKADCASLVTLLQHFPLRAKKARDFAIWSEAVRWWTAQHRKGPGHPRNQAHFDWSVMERLHRQLVVGRTYQAEEPSETVSNGIGHSGRIRLFVD